MLGEYGTLTPRIDWQHKSSYSMVWNPADKDPLGYGKQEAFDTFDVSAQFSHASGKWSVNAYCKNITNYAVKKSYMGMMSYTMMIGDPRTYGASLSVKF
jgi:outer membrane receptor protein involved in Fe transport